MTPAPAVDAYAPLTDPHDHPEPHSYKWTQSEMDYINRRVAAAIAAHEAKTKSPQDSPSTDNPNHP